jgi:hypothetical protein
VFALSGPVVYVPVQVFPVHEGAGSETGLLLPTVTRLHELPLFGPPYVIVTVPPAGMVVGEAVRVSGTIVNVTDFAGDVVVPEVAVA